MTYLKFHRYTLQMTQAKLAKAAGMSQTHYCEIERGIKRPGPKQLGKLAEAIKRPKEELIAKLYGVDPASMVLSHPSVAAR